MSTCTVRPSATTAPPCFSLVTESDIAKELVPTRVTPTTMVTVSG
jgi:hypothetical protein